MKRCLIFGQNGLDLDVTLNLVAFYKKLGFDTIFSTKLTKADLLVIVRPIDAPLVISKFGYTQIHIYDYVGWLYDACLKSLDLGITYIFTTNEKQRKYLLDTIRMPKDHVYVSLPPVECSLWVEKSVIRKYKYVHVGNYKKIRENDEFRDRFNSAMEKLGVDIWGISWVKSDLYNYHGKAGLFNVSKIYAKSKCALGLMYPFQREVTYSGRFWHAPLNGCLLVSEPGLYTKYFPGVIETDYTLKDLSKINLEIIDHQKIQSEAIAFWCRQNDNHRKIVSRFIDQVGISICFLRIDLLLMHLMNSLKVFYQKWQLFKVKAWL
jgi:hypothetical protein